MRMAFYPSLLRFTLRKAIAGCTRRSLNLCGKVMSTMSEAVVSPSPPSPGLMIPPTFKGRALVFNWYSLSDGKVVSFNETEELNLDGERMEVVGSSQGWLAQFNRSNFDLFLTNPLSRRHIKLPNIYTLPIQGDDSARAGKVNISVSPDNQDCRAMMTYDTWRRLAFCVPGRSTEWIPIGALCSYENPYDDFVYSTREETFFCVTPFGHLEEWDLRDPQSPKLIMQDIPAADREKDIPLKEMCSTQKFLVVTDGGDILLGMRYILECGILRSDGSYFEYTSSDVDKYPRQTIEFEVYKYDRKECRLRLMEGSLDGLALFIGLNHSIALATRDFPELKPNSIYFADSFNECNLLDYTGHDIGIFNYEDGTISPCYYPCDPETVKKIVPSPIWFTPNPQPPPREDEVATAYR